MTRRQIQLRQLNALSALLALQPSNSCKARSLRAQILTLKSQLNLIKSVKVDDAALESKAIVRPLYQNTKANNCYAIIN